jgi:hypothetical protein
MVAKGEQNVRRVEAPAVLSTDDGGQNTKAQIHSACIGRVDLGRGGLAVTERVHLTALPIVEATGRAYPLAEAKGQDLASMSILALRPEESKSQNDLPQLPHEMSEVWKRSQG